MSISRRDCLFAGVAISALAHDAVARTTDLMSIASPPTLRVARRGYTWSWTAVDDRFSVIGQRGLEIASAPLQPVLVLFIAGRKATQRGVLRSARLLADRAEFVYTRADAQVRITVSVKFAEDRFWFEPVGVDGAGAAQVVELHWFSTVEQGVAKPGLEHQFAVIPGFSMSDAISPIVTSIENLDETVWLGRGASPGERMFQQWGLPVHYFAGFNRAGALGERASVPGKLSGAYCCGLETVPAADLQLHTQGGRYSLLFRYHGELWGQARLPGHLTLGSRLLWTVGDDFREAIRHYYQAIQDSGAIARAAPGAAKRARMTGTAVSMWGAQVATGKIGDRMDQSELESIYSSLRQAGFRFDTFLIEDRWESLPGSLVHDAQRFPQFDSFLQRLRDDHVQPSLWVTPLRCPQPQHIGLESRHLLRSAVATHAPKAAPIIPYPILDISQPEVADNLGRRLQHMMRRYRPGLIKFDFGYEMPPLSLAAPADMAYAGERLLLRAAQILANAVRAVDPDVAILYYGLSPFLLPYTDLHSPDDAFASGGDYDIEINRRIYFSSLLGELGMPTYGSGGYDWQSAASVWFDTALMGPLGIIADARGDERGATPTPEMVALFNGLRAASRRTTTFSIDVVPMDLISPAKGARSASWIRREHGRTVGLALRREPWMGSPGSGRLDDILEADVSVVVTSLTDESLTISAALAIVPLASGRVQVRRDVGAVRILAIHHFANGSVLTEVVSIHPNFFVLDLKIKSADGVPLEWCEVQFQ